MRKIIPGFRFFECTECGNKWKDSCRDCYSLSGESCRCDCFITPHEAEEHLEWLVDECGNIINEEQYENKN